MAPTWAILGPYKKFKDIDEYTVAFETLIHQRMVTDLETWLSIANGGDIAFGCYCNRDAFCHRHLIVDYFEAFCKQENISFERMGELIPN